MATTSSLEFRREINNLNRVKNHLGHSTSCFNYLHNNKKEEKK